MWHPDTICRLWIHEAQCIFYDRLINEDVSVDYDDLYAKPVIFADFFKPDLEEIRDFPKLTSVLNDVLDVYNVSFIAHMHVVFFLDAVQHISHLEMPRGETACSASVFINCLLTVCKQSNSTDLHILHLNEHIWLICYYYCYLVILIVIEYLTVAFAIAFLWLGNARSSLWLSWPGLACLSIQTNRGYCISDLREDMKKFMRTTGAYCGTAALDNARSHGW